MKDEAQRLSELGTHENSYEGPLAWIPEPTNDQERGEALKYRKDLGKAMEVSHRMFLFPPGRNAWHPAHKKPVRIESLSGDGLFATVFDYETKLTSEVPKNELIDPNALLISGLSK